MGLVGCSGNTPPETPKDQGVATLDQGVADLGGADAGQIDTGVDLGGDLGTEDMGPLPEDLGTADTGVDTGVDLGVDLGAADLGSQDIPTPADMGEGPDLGPQDGGADVGPGDQGPADMGGLDTGAPDLGLGDTGPGDAGLGDTGPGDAGAPDLGVDAGVPAMCLSDLDCVGGGRCLDDAALTPCVGGACSCFSVCDPFVQQTMSGCGAGEACAWLGQLAQPPAICFPDQGGALQGQACSATFDAAGNILQDSCNRTQNVFCVGATPAQPTGTCATLCGTANPGLCTALGNFVCDDLGDPNAGFGLCLIAPPAFTDIGNSCQLPADCQGAVCSTTLANSCSSSCDGLQPCAAGSLCVNAGVEGAICAATCAFGAAGDAFCSGRNANTVCENIGGPEICIPRCQANADCPSGVCNMMTGHCL